MRNYKNSNDDWKTNPKELGAGVILAMLFIVIMMSC